MKGLTTLYILLCFGSVLTAQDQILIHHHSGTDILELRETDSIYFNADQTVIYFVVDGFSSEYYVDDIDSITFEAETDSTVSITYNGKTATVINPLEGAGLEVTVSAADVTVYASEGVTGVSYIVSGITEDGMLKIYSEEKFDLLLDNTVITNKDGPAINIQSKRKATVYLIPGSLNTITDGTTYTDPAVEGEDQKAAFFSEGDLIFSGSGSLVIHGNGSDQHAIRSDESIQINEGNIAVLSAVKDGIHGKEGFVMNGGTLSISSSGDGIDGDEGMVVMSGGNLTIYSTVKDVNGIHSDTTMVISGGTIQITVDGDQSKGIDSNKEIIISGGSITVETSGGVVLESLGQGYDPSYCTAINCSGDITISDTELHLDIQGAAGRGISCDGNLTVNSGEFMITAAGNGDTYTNTEGSKDSYHGLCIKADGNFNFVDGSMALSNSGSGGRGVVTDGDLIIGSSMTSPALVITTTGDKIQISSGSGGGRPGPPGDEGEYDEAKAIKCNGAVTINSGSISINSADDGIKSLTSITLNDGLVDIQQSYEGLESPNITINAGELGIISTDDGFNATYGNGGEANDGSQLSILGGYSYVSSSQGDAVDSNGNILISGGTTVAHGPQSDPEVGMDVNGTCIITGGFLVISGTNSNMTEGASSSSTQYSLLIRTNTSFAANTIFRIEDASGNDMVTFAPSRTYSSIVFSSADLSGGGIYSIFTGGTCSGENKDGLYTGGTYTGGTFRKSFTISGTVTNVSF